MNRCVLDWSQSKRTNFCFFCDSFYSWIEGSAALGISILWIIFINSTTYNLFHDMYFIFQLSDWYCSNSYWLLVKNLQTDNCFCNMSNSYQVKDYNNFAPLFLNLMQVQPKKNIILKILNVLKHIIIVMIMYWARLRGHEFRSSSSISRALATLEVIWVPGMWV